VCREALVVVGLVVNIVVGGLVNKARRKYLGNGVKLRIHKSNLKLAKGFQN
jgi:hypothetical protein